ncbi:MAG: ABC transporter ATP-binding protein [Candidatus Heimdallarchaeum aukensis]|uniref:Molybdate/tungstate import ATP-binding protein WtpC n=1 Tax=Candidatus Heimdallarchaeum aukensis TaxID=2876573 RepID=A0A9Y1BLE4_9ARCH|nr:MAG: ABC transporter ATP-binding protein [Candidatus Heimdallarchaeum aukensis]
MVSVRMENVTKKYGKVIGIKDLSLSINDGEYVAILGPTGAGKTTTMYILAGLISPSSGKVFFDDVDVTDVPAEDRQIGFVFEEYNLFPRMNVEKNILFGPIVKNLDLSVSRKVALELLDLLNIKGKEKNYPNEISGGQKQRVALARAIVSNAKLLIMDDPLRALDAKIRDILQVELRKLVKDLGLTCIHATHDTHEAMRVADRILVFKDGQIVQDGTPEEIYNNPNSIYVADFLGENVSFRGEIFEEKEERYLLTENNLKLKVQTNYLTGTKVVALVPLELIDVYPKEESNSLNYDNIISGKLIKSKLIGEFFELILEISGMKIKAYELIGKKNIPTTPNSDIVIAMDKDDFRIFELENEKVINNEKSIESEEDESKRTKKLVE